jgi:glutamate dehydrogenase/leucine dehydrogenase
VSDVRPEAVAAVVERTGAAEAAADAAHAVPCDLYAPCALGGALSATTIGELRCAAVVGSANNQLATPQDAQRIHDSGVLYAPDYVVNAGGVINIAQERHGYDRARAEQRIRGIHDTVLEVLALADAERCTTADAADRVAERRIDAARRAARARPPGDLTATAGM